MQFLGQREMHKINHANIKDWAKNYKGELFDGILCDPPYELGFMGKSWDSSGIAFDSEMWADLLRLLKPGAHLLAFSGSRTYHRMAVAIEDAGFEIRDQLIWMYGSGFPKALDISKALDKSLGETRERIKVPEAARGSVDYGKYNGEIDDNNPITDIAKLYQGYKTSLKPAHEPCVLARKPIEGTVAQNVLKHGTGGLNIDGTRVGTTGARFNGRKVDSDIYGKYGVAKPKEDYNMGRFPANLIHDGSDEVEAVFPQTKSGAMNSTTKGHDPDTFNTYGKQYVRQVTNPASTGSASRFFYTAKASKSERNAGLEGFEGNTQQTLIGNSPTCVDCNKTYNGTNNHNDCSGEMFNKPRVSQTNHHPTVKPLSLTKYLATLIKPPTGGRLLVPFSGSGSEMIGALQAGWEYVEGVELTEEYIPIAEARIKYWQNIPQTSSKPKVSARKVEPVQNKAESLTLF